MKRRLSVIALTAALGIPAVALAGSDDPLSAGLREFGRAAWVEAEILDSVTKEPVFAVVDRAANIIPNAARIETWRDLQKAFDAWAVQAAKDIAALRSAR